jgi:hypothetical protein
MRNNQGSSCLLGCKDIKAKVRDRYPREAHGLTIGACTRNPMDILGATDKSRLPELLPERYKRCSQNAFSFYRGGVALMAFDLSKASIAGINVQACGIVI